MLQTIDEHAVTWHCLGDEETPCNATCIASLEEVEYQADYTLTLLDAETGQAIQARPDGAVMVLPACACGARMWLKADYTMAYFRRRSSFIEFGDGQGIVQLRTLKPGHARNLVLHQLLYERGKAPIPPILPALPAEEWEHPIMELGLTASLWFTFHLLTQSTDSTLFEQYFVEAVHANKKIARVNQLQLQGNHGNTTTRFSNH